MSTPNINCILQAVLAVQNNLISPTPQIVTIDLGNPTLNGTVFFYEQYIQATTTGVGQGMPGPGGIAYLAVVQNLSTTSNLTITVIPNGGVQNILTLGPGGVWIYCDPKEVGGISGLTLTGVGATVPALIMVAV